jgi:hypothetical protein
MYTPVEDEKLTTVMIYTHDGLYRGDVVSKVSVVRVSLWLRSQGVPDFFHMLKPQVLLFGSGAAKTLNFSEMFISRADVIAFHLVPPASDPVDYEADEKNRLVVPVTAMVGTFLFAGNLRVSAQTGLKTSIEGSRSNWMSAYEVDITNPYLPQMAPIHVPMLLLNPSKVNFGLA